jgi:hypothetical protein
MVQGARVRVSRFPCVVLGLRVSLGSMSSQAVPQPLSFEFFEDCESQFQLERPYSVTSRPPTRNRESLGILFRLEFVILDADSVPGTSNKVGLWHAPPNILPLTRPLVNAMQRTATCASASSFGFLCGPGPPMDLEG